jgi:alginate O-acetyltransferase complex protein AlgI
MVFSSVLFLFIYLPVTLAVYYAVPHAWRNPVLFVFSLIFYGWGEPVYILLMLFSITLNHFAALALEKRRGTAAGKRLLAATVAVNLALLFFFKYGDFVLANLSALFGANIPLLGLELPIGISFYTFQAMSYPIDVWRGDSGAQKSLINTGTFVTLFPQLIAGPIVRYKDIAAELSSRRSAADFSEGCLRFTVGLCKKVLLANAIGRLWEQTSALPLGELSAMSALLGAVAFSFQIYFDFSGYSDMAIGLGKMLGFHFLENFNYPYISKSITEFWRRWHISLSTWFRDYVYIPLGGNRRGLKRQLLNLLIVWTLTGIWHGAAWNFLLWGLYFAVLLIVEKVFLLRRLEKAPSWVGRVYTLALVLISWVIFSITDISALGGYFAALFGKNGFADGRFLYDIRSYAGLLVILVIASTPAAKKLWQRLPQKARVWAAPVLMLAGLALSAAGIVNSSYNPFLYFRF